MTETQPSQDAAPPESPRSTSAALVAALVACVSSVPVAAVGYFVIEIFYRNKLMGRSEGDVTTRIGGEGAIGDFLVALADGFVAAGLAGMFALWLLPRSHRRRMFLFSAVGYVALAVVLWLYASRGGAASPLVAGFWAATVLGGALAGSYIASVIDLSDGTKSEPPSEAPSA